MTPIHSIPYSVAHLWREVYKYYSYIIREHRKCFAYEAHTVCDRRGYVLEAEVTPGNVHDSVAFDKVFERLIEHSPEVKVITADAGYKTPWICKQIFDSGRIPSLPYRRPMTKKGKSAVT